MSRIDLSFSFITCPGNIKMWITPKKEKTMEYRIEQLNDIKIAGIKTITDNQEGIELIPRTWGRFFSENIIEKIDNKVPSPFMYAVYTEFESDENGKYTFMIGAQVDNADINDTVNAKATLPSGKYAVFTAKNRDDVINVWQHVWQGGLNRNYTTDFERYDMSNEEVSVYVGLK